MLGLWGIGSVPLGLTLHIAFEVTIDNLLDAPRLLKDQGITSLSFYDVETTQPSVIGWMPAATIYLRDPDGNLIEYLAMLDDEPNLSVLELFHGRSGLLAKPHNRSRPHLRTFGKLIMCSVAAVHETFLCKLYSNNLMSLGRSNFLNIPSPK